MSEPVGAFEAKTHLSALIDRVERGEIITITRRGKAVARLVPIDDDVAARRAEAIERIRQDRRGVRLGDGITVRELIDEGRKR